MTQSGHLGFFKKHLKFGQIWTVIEELLAFSWPRARFVISPKKECLILNKLLTVHVLKSAIPKNKARGSLYLPKVISRFLENLFQFKGLDIRLRNRSSSK